MATLATLHESGEHHNTTKVQTNPTCGSNARTTALSPSRPRLYLLKGKERKHHHHCRRTTSKRHSRPRCTNAQNADSFLPSTVSSKLGAQPQRLTSHESTHRKYNIPHRDYAFMCVSSSVNSKLGYVPTITFKSLKSCYRNVTHDSTGESKFTAERIFPTKVGGFRRMYG